MSLQPIEASWAISYGELQSAGILLVLHGTLTFTVTQEYVVTRSRFWVDGQLISDITDPSSVPTPVGEYVHRLEDSPLPITSRPGFSLLGHTIQAQFDYRVIATTALGTLTLGPTKFLINTEIAVDVTLGLGAAGTVIYLVKRKGKKR